MFIISTMIVIAGACVQLKTVLILINVVNKIFVPDKIQGLLGVIDMIQTKKKST